MSLILSSERNSKIIRNKSSILTPSFLNISESFHQNKAPFNSKMERYFEFSDKRNSKVGPGLYYHPKQRSFLKKSFGRNSSSLEEMNRSELYNLALFKVVNRKKSIKLKEQKSLIIDRENKNQVCNINNINSYNDFNKSSLMDENKKNVKFLPTTLTKNRINSIPSREQYLGYDFDKNGLPIIVDSTYITALDNKNNENEENIIIEKDKKINAVDWSKMSKRDIIGKDNNISNDYTTKENTTNIINSISEELNELTASIIKTNISNLNRKKKLTRNKNEILNSLTNNEPTTDYHNFSKYLKSKLPFTTKINGIRYRSPESFLFTKKKKSLEEFVYDNLFNCDPGPGYYQSESDFDKYAAYKQRNKNIKYNFGSNAIRNGALLKSDNNTNIGPGSYFKENYKPKIKPDFFPLSRKEYGINIKKYEKDFEKEEVGPGKYEIKSQFDKTQLYYNGPLEPRFFDNIKKIKVGPGEYLPLYDWNKNSEKVEKNKKDKDKDKDKDKSTKDEKKEINERDSYINKNENPGVGAYNPHIVNSIHYDIISKENKMSNLRMPFSSAQERFIYKSSSSSDLLGPGRYFSNNKSLGNIRLKTDKNKGLYRNIGYKNDDIKKFYNQIKLEGQRNVGPGSYELRNYNEWYKKSFNAKYV